MKKKLTFLFGLILIFTAVLNSCSSDDSVNNSDNKPKVDFTIYKNQSNDPNANALQAQAKTNEATLNFYGKFDNERNPTTIETISYQKNGNDTLVNFIYDNSTSKISSIFLEVKDVKLPTLFKFTYPESGNYVNVQVVNYNWNTNSFETLSSANVLIENNLLKALNKRSGSFSDFVVTAASIHLAIQITSTVVATAGPVLALVSPVALPILTVTGAIIGANLIIDLMMDNKAHASEIKPEDISYPPKTKIENPKPETFKDEVIKNDCTAVLIKFGASMDSQGNILLFGGEGGTPPYSYMLEGIGGFTPVAVYNSKPNGSYKISIKDANGCITAKIVSLKRPCDLEISVSKTVNSATVTVTKGQPPYTYSWSNGATTQSISGLNDGTYTVTVTDNNDCQVSESVTIGESNNYLVGNWTLIQYKLYGEVSWKNVNQWYDYYSANCSMIELKENITGNAIISANSYEIRFQNNWIDYNIDTENCISQGQSTRSALQKLFGTYAPQVVIQNNKQIFNTITNYAQEIRNEQVVDEWTNPGSFFEIENENTMILRIPEDDDWLYAKFQRL